MEVARGSGIGILPMMSGSSWAGITRPDEGRRRGRSPSKGDSCGLLEGDARDFELEGFGPSVGDHEAGLGEGFAGVIGQVEAVAAADGNHGAEGDFDFFPSAGRGEFRGVVMAGIFFRFDQEAVIFAVALQPDDRGAVGRDVDRVEVILHGGKSAVVFEGHFAAEDGVAGGVEGYFAFGESAHDSVILDPPSAHRRGVGEVEEDFFGSGGHDGEYAENGEESKEGLRGTGHNGCGFALSRAG